MNENKRRDDEASTALGMTAAGSTLEAGVPAGGVVGGELTEAQLELANGGLTWKDVKDFLLGGRHGDWTCEGLACSTGVRG